MMFFLLLACTGSPTDESINPEPLPLVTPSIVPDPITDVRAVEGVLGSRAVADTGQAVGTSLTLGTVGDRIRFTEAALSASAGLIRIRFTNNAAAGAMQHNMVIVPAGKEEDIGVAAIAAGESARYLPDSPDVLAATEMLRAGESDTLVVDLPPGTYAFLCTFPGHYLQMRGTLTVT